MKTRTHIYKQTGNQKQAHQHDDQNDYIIYIPSGNAPAIDCVHMRKNLKLCSSKFDVESIKTNSDDCWT